DWGVPGKHITLVAIVASAEGIDALHAAHPDITVHVAAVDEVLNGSGYVVPGVGDAGDRLFNTPH
ncbi:uracil phosphoribosyltransferase-domain-containing protein, partial [Catenaria anguillulae PL171]